MSTRSRFLAAVLLALVLGAPAAADAARPAGAHARHHAHPGHGPRHAGRRASLRHGRAAAKLGVTGGCAAADLTATETGIAELRAAVVCLVNSQRTARGLPPVREDGRLDRSAQGWAHQMVATRTFGHEGFGTDPSSRIRAAGYGWWAYGENIATGYSTPRQVMRGWMASPGHCRNVLDPSFADLGVGVVGAAVRSFASGPATWAEDFGLPAGDRARSRNAGPQSGCPYRV